MGPLRPCHQTRQRARRSRRREGPSRHRFERSLLGLDEDVHRPAALRRDRRPAHLRRQHHRDRHRLLPTRQDPPPTRQHRPMSHPPASVMVVYALTEPVDDFDALTPLPDWITADPIPRTHWTLQADLALADAAHYVRWDGEMRHLPSVGAVLAPPE